jgi:conjugal transfer/entry exclusion protein
MQVMQAGNQISGLMVNQLMDLQATIMSAEQVRLNHVAVQENRLEQDRLRQQKFIRKAQGVY